MDGLNVEVLLLVSFILSILMQRLAALDVKYDHSAYLDSTEKYKLQWSVDRVAEKIQFGVSVKASGYVGFGLSNGLSGRMLGADIVIGWVDSNGEGHLQDFHGIGETMPKLDTRQDYKLLKAEEKNGVTTIHFERVFDTCDPEQDHPIKEGTFKVIWSYSSYDPQGGDSSTFQYHMANRGARSLNLLNYIKDSPPPAGAKFFDVLQPNIEVPGADTSYRCVSYKIPPLGGRKHIIEIAPVIQKGNEGFVHHIDIYECAHNFPEHHVNITGDCYNHLMPAEFKACKNGAIAYAWAIGGTTFKLPDHVGLGVGGPGDIKYVVMEIHYDNPQMVSGKRDSSGLRFYYTEKIRKYDAATFFVNQLTSKGFIIPPRKDSWITKAQCPSEITKKPGRLQSNFKNNGIKIFAVCPHSHLAGRAMWLKHIKEDGTEYPEIFRDDNYDFNYQQTSILTKERTFLPGEALNVYCRYETKQRTSAIPGGQSTKDEMCFFFMLYYPKQTNFTSCSSYFPAATDVFEKKYAKLDSVSKKYSWKDVPWNKTMEDELKRIYAGKKMSVLITAVQKEQVITGVPITEITKPQIVHQKVCSVNGAVNTRSISAVSLALAMVIQYSMVFSI